MLKIQKLSLKIGDKKALNNISFEAQNGTLTVITGSNGSGKTTLLSCIMGILQQSSGKIVLNNKDISTLDLPKRAKEGFSLALQHPTLFKGLTIKDLLETANPKAKNLDVACEYLSKVGLCARNYLDREFNATLSGGERKRIELALTLAQNAHVLMFDEPESGIDMWSFEALTALFENLKKEGKIVVIVSHNPKIIEMANHVLVLKDGKILPSAETKKSMSKILNTSCKKLSGGQK